MMMSMFLLTAISMGMTITLAFSPLTLGFWVLMLALITAIVTSLSSSSWFGFIIFLIYIGGMLVMFAYFTAIQPNQQLKITTPFIAMTLTPLILFLLNTPQTIDQVSNKNWWISTMYEGMNLSSLIFLALALFLALICIVKISFMNRAPLRPFIYV